MERRAGIFQIMMVVVICIGMSLSVSFTIYAHCDTLDGPVIKDAKLALEKGDVTPVLKWVKEDHEDEIITALNRALVDRVKGPEDKEKADMGFFETLVRIHREGEGAPFTGLKPAGAEPIPAVAEADKALEADSVDNLMKLMTETVEAGLQERFNRVMEKKKHMNESVEAGREYVEAYVEFVHYAERLYLDAKGEAGNHGQELEGHHGTQGKM